jgi:hypothetical protein
MRFSDERFEGNGFGVRGRGSSGALRLLTCRTLSGKSELVRAPGVAWGLTDLR